MPSEAWHVLAPLGAIVALVLVPLIFVPSRSDRDAWAKAVRQHLPGLEPAPEASDSSGSFNRIARGLVDGVDVEVSVGQAHTEVTFWSAAGPTCSMRYARADPGSTAAKGRMSIGDPVLDEFVAFEGSRDAIVAMLDMPLRKRLFKALDAKWRYARGQWRLVFDGEDWQYLAGAVKEGVALSKLLATAAEAARDVPAALAARARTDPMMSYRLSALDALVHNHRGSPHATAAVDAALVDAESTVRFFAARLRADVGVLAAIAADARSPVADDAILHIIEHFPALAATLETLSQRNLSARLEQPRESLRLAACRALAALGNTDAIPALVALRDRAGKVERMAASDAILAIQARAGAVENGRLTLSAADAEGALAIADERSESI